MAQQILIVEKANSLRENLGQRLRQKGYQLLETDLVDSALKLLSVNKIHLVLLGLEGLKRNGIILMKEIRTRYPSVRIITINSGEQLDLSIEAMRLGAFDDFLIPFDLDELLTQIYHAIENKPSDHQTPSD